MTDIPTLDTERLILRPYRNSDFDDYAAMWADAVVTKFIGGHPFSREQSWTRFVRQRGMWATMGFGFWAVEEKGSGAFIGEAGFHDLKREISPSIEGTLETGWGFVPSAHGKGIATEIVAKLVSWAESTRPQMRVTCIIDPGNAASIRVAERHGFREFARATYMTKPIILFERQKQ